MKLILTCKKKNVRCIDLTFHFNSSTFCHYSVGHLVVKLESASCCTSWPSSCWSSVEGAASAGGSNWLWGSILPRHRRQHLSCWLSWLCHLWSHADRPAAGEKKKKKKSREWKWVTQDWLWGPGWNERSMDDNWITLHVVSEGRRISFTMDCSKVKVCWGTVGESEVREPPGVTVSHRQLHCLTTQPH